MFAFRAVRLWFEIGLGFKPAFKIDSSFLELNSGLVLSGFRNLLH